MKVIINHRLLSKHRLPLSILFLIRCNQLPSSVKSFPSDFRACRERKARSIVFFFSKRSRLVLVYCLVIFEPQFQNYLFICEPLSYIVLLFRLLPLIRKYLALPRHPGWFNLVMSSVYTDTSSCSCSSWPKSVIHCGPHPPITEVIDCCRFSSLLCRLVVFHAKLSLLLVVQIPCFPAQLSDFVVIRLSSLLFNIGQLGSYSLIVDARQKRVIW